MRQGDRIVVDISDSGPQTKGPVNFITTYSFMNLMFARYLMSYDPSLLLNEGLFHIVDELRTKPGHDRRSALPGRDRPAQPHSAAAELVHARRDGPGVRRAVGGQLAGLLPVHAGDSTIPRPASWTSARKGSGQGWARARTPTAWT